ncbi:hypothetical protein QQM41_03455 [Acetobacter sp. AC2005]|uniref:hypothetical protein n=1 Tax=Acetobacter sp. AC2005 TaxID=3134142 RepID=UPI0030CEBC7D
MSYSLESCSADNNVWNHVKSCWRGQCEDFGEEFETYAQASMSVLDSLAYTPSKNAKVYVLYKTEAEQKEPLVAFQANVAFLPGFDGKVLRIRHIVMSPKYDYGEMEETGYTNILVETFSRATALGYGELEAKHVKFHFKTPADLYFFRAMCPSLDEEKEFRDVKAYGAWISFSFNAE